MSDITQGELDKHSLISVSFYQTYTSMKTDEILQKNVKEELRWDPILEACQIGVSVSEGIVTLSGEVDTYQQKMAMEQAAKRVEGVKAVVQEIIIIPIFGFNLWTYK